MDRVQVDEEDIASPGGYLHTRETERERERERVIIKYVSMYNNTVGFHTGFSIRGDDVSVLKQKLSRGVWGNVPPPPPAPPKFLTFKTFETVI